jgi:hypothetical protein
MNLAGNLCEHDVKTGTVACDKISEAVDLTLTIGKGTWANKVADLFTLNATSKKYDFNMN